MGDPGTLVSLPDYRPSSVVYRLPSCNLRASPLVLSIDEHNASFLGGLPDGPEPSSFILSLCLYRR
jgi:hypothetical protein